MIKQLHKLLLFIAATFFVSNGYAHDVEIDGIFYNLNASDKTASVTFKRGADYHDRYIGDVTIPASITHYGYIYSVTSIEAWAFGRCSGLVSVTIPSTVTSIGDCTFKGCSGLTSIIIPFSVTTIGTDAFDSCSSLTSINVSSDNPEYSSADGVLYNKNKTILVTCPGGKTGPFAIPSSVITIGDDAFSGCSSLTSVTIPPSVTSIGAWAFADCNWICVPTINNKKHLQLNH